MHGLKSKQRLCQAELVGGASRHVSWSERVQIRAERFARGLHERVPTISAKHFCTLATPSQIAAALQGDHLQGQSEPRVVFVGRSNVGKSSLINAIVETKVAQTSAQPGKTQALHFYLWKEGRKVIADLPGYGYAKASKEDRDRWGRFIEAYLKADSNLERALVLMDARHGPTDLDLEALGFLSSLHIPVTLVFTKSDALKNQSERARRLKETSEALKAVGLDPRQAYWVSVEKDPGLRQLQELVRSLKT